MVQNNQQFYCANMCFYSVRLRDEKATLLTDEIDTFRNAVRHAMRKHPFLINAAVVLPNAAHMIWTLPEGDHADAKRWQMIKATFSRHVPAAVNRSARMIKRGEKGIWHKSHWKHAIRDQQDFDLHMHLIATAPIRAGLVAQPHLWPYGSAARRQTPRLHAA